jgi:hypothetical protein
MSRRRFFGMFAALGGGVLVKRSPCYPKGSQFGCGDWTELPPLYTLDAYGVMRVWEKGGPPEGKIVGRYSYVETHEGFYSVPIDVINGESKVVIPWKKPAKSGKRRRSPWSG